MKKREMKRANRADTFAVGDMLPEALLRELTPEQISLLKRYVEDVAEGCYRLAFDHGVEHSISAMKDLLLDKQN